MSRHTSPVVSRRRFVGLSAAALGLVGTGGAGALLSGCVPASPPPPGTNPARNPLRIPPVRGTSAATLRAARTTVDLGGGAWSTVQAYDGLVPGPTLVATRGDPVSVAFTNDLADATSVHWHGMVVPTAADGQPLEAVAAGGSRRYAFPVVQRAAMNWYHPHPHLMTGSQVNLGLAGGFLVRDAEESALGLPGSWREVPLVIRDASFDSSGNLTYKPRSSGFEGTVPLVNGTRSAKLGVESAVYRFRILQGSNARVFRLALGSGGPFVLIGNDGGLLARAATVSQVVMGPGERVDVLIDLRGLRLGTRLVLRDIDTGWDLLELEVTREVGDATTIPTTLSSIAALGSPVRTRTFSFDGMSRINGLAYDMDRIDFSVPFGETERWRFLTGGNAPHPVHVHGASFQVVSRTGGRAALMPWESGWKDTVLLQDGETVDVLIRFDGYRGRYLLHCHQLEHEDGGMMSTFQVV